MDLRAQAGFSSSHSANGSWCLLHAGPVLFVRGAAVIQTDKFLPSRNLTFQLEKETESKQHTQIIMGVGVSAWKEVNKMMCEYEGPPEIVQTRQVLTEEVTFALAPKDEKEQPCEKQRESILDRRNNKCKGPAAGKGLTF